MPVALQAFERAVQLVQRDAWRLSKYKLQGKNQSSDSNRPGENAL